MSYQLIIMNSYYLLIFDKLKPYFIDDLIRIILSYKGLDFESNTFNKDFDFDIHNLYFEKEKIYFDSRNIYFDIITKNFHNMDFNTGSNHVHYVRDNNIITLGEHNINIYDLSNNSLKKNIYIPYNREIVGFCNNDIYVLCLKNLIKISLKNYEVSTIHYFNFEDYLYGFCFHIQNYESYIYYILKDNIIICETSDFYPKVIYEIGIKKYTNGGVKKIYITEDYIFFYTIMNTTHILIFYKDFTFLRMIDIGFISGYRFGLHVKNNIMYLLQSTRFRIFELY
mgnify:CR=1 FL=1|jgi:hypothetical protein